MVDALNIVQVVLSVLREDVNKGERDWSSFASELERVFTEEADNGVLDRKRELSALLKVGGKISVHELFLLFLLNIMVSVWSKISFFALKFGWSACMSILSCDVHVI